MKAMILAAGHGTRMRPLTNHTPKPLLPVGGKPLIVWHIEKLAKAGYQDIVINIGWLGDQIPAALGNGERWGINLHYSDEQQEGVLETAGGIIKALPLLDDEPFLVINGDIWCDYSCQPVKLKGDDLVHLVLVNNPPHHPEGDFALQEGRVSDNKALACYTFSGIGFYHPALFDKLSYGKQALAPLLRSAMQNKRVSGELHQGEWLDIGTPERLRVLDEQLSAKQVTFSN
uniref:Glucose-1-phosphate thymidylyltransferase (EC) n=1 Tax=uncultured Thiotrichaceae bacterium TaxID=298394 RepID=A0A6S6SDZ5_9GAMM|nr:MAG: Glucose-1-phosphate thymidylyltransferase (EC [uncultured Thiotrichaceae bacterium]